LTPGVKSPIGERKTQGLEIPLLPKLRGTNSNA